MRGESSLSEHVIEAEFLVDQAYGHIEIVLMKAKKEPDLVAPEVPRKLESILRELYRIAGKIDSLRGRVM